MKIGIISDTHRNKPYLMNVVDWLSRKQRISTLYHLGDDYEDMVDLADDAIDVVQVPGIYDPHYLDKTTPRTITETVMGIQILLVHSIDKDVTSADKRVVDIILHGHTHHAELRLEDGLFYMNPGHLKGPMDKNMAPSFGLLEIIDQNISATIIGLDFKTIQTMEIVRSQSGLYKV